MTKSSSTQLGHNVDKSVTDLDSNVADIRRKVTTAKGHMASHDEALFAALGETLDLGQQIADKRQQENDEDWEFLKKFMAYHDRLWSAKCDQNFFHGIVDIVFNFVDQATKLAFVKAPTLSKYRLILRFAFDHNLTGSDLVSDLHLKTFTAVYEEAVLFYGEFARSPSAVSQSQDREAQLGHPIAALLTGRSHGAELFD